MTTRCFQPKMFSMVASEQVEVLSRLRAMRARGVLTDLVIRAVDGSRIEEFPTHRCVIASNDGYFGALLAGAGSSMREAGVESIELDVDPELMEMVVNFLYGGEVQVEFERVMDLLAVAVRLQVRALASQCTETLRRHINERNCVELLRASAAHGCDELRAAAHDAVVAWFPSLLRRPNALGTKDRCASEDSGDGVGVVVEERVASERATRRAARRTAERDATKNREERRVPAPAWQSGFATLPAALALDILASDRLACDEGLVFSAAIAWVQARGDQTRPRPSGSKKRRRARDVDEAEEDAEAVCDEILRRVRYPLMDATFLADVVKPHGAMQTPSRAALVSEAFEHIALRAAGRDRGALEDGCSSGSLYGLAERAEPRKPGVAARAWPPRFDLARPFDQRNGHDDAVSALCVCAGRVVSGSWDSTVRVWDPQTGVCEKILEEHVGAVRALASVSRHLASAVGDGTIRVWDPSRAWSLCETLADHSAIVNAIVALHDASNHFASSGDDGVIKIWSTTDWRCQLTLHTEARVGVLVLASMAAPGALVSGSDDAKIHVWNTANWQLETTLEEHSDEVWALAVVGDHLVSGSVDHTIKIWRRSPDWLCEKTVRAHDGPVYALANLQDHLVSGSSDETIQAWSHDWECENAKGTNCSGVWCLTVHNDRLVTGGVNGMIKIWDP